MDGPQGWLAVRPEPGRFRHTVEGVQECIAPFIGSIDRIRVRLQSCTCPCCEGQHSAIVLTHRHPCWQVQAAAPAFRLKFYLMFSFVLIGVLLATHHCVCRTTATPATLPRLLSPPRRATHACNQPVARPFVQPAIISASRPPASTSGRRLCSRCHCQHRWCANPAIRARFCSA